MASRKTSHRAIAGRKTAAKNGQSEAALVARDGIDTSRDLARLMTALIGDVLEERVTPAVVNAACRAASNLLRVVELSYRHGVSGRDGRRSVSLLNAKQP